jgi:AraC-type transcriptional regulator N-terminus
MKAKKSEHSNDPQIAQVLYELADAISKVAGTDSEVSTAVPGLTLYRNIVPTAPNPCTYVPSLLVIPQGKKRIDLGKQSPPHIRRTSDRQPGVRCQCGEALPGVLPQA